MSAPDDFFDMHKGPFKFQEEADWLWIEDASGDEVDTDHMLTLLNELWKARKP
jgi:hypothetical protein